MQRINKLIIWGVSLLLMASCQDFLDTASPSKIPDTEFFIDNESEGKLSVDGVYANIAQDRLYGSRSTIIFSCNTDEEVHHVNPGIDNGRAGVLDYTSNSDNTNISDFWEESYKAIDRANQCLLAFDKGTLLANSQLKPCLGRQLYGEVVALRALLYSDLVRLHGDVPFHIKPANAQGDLYPKQTDRDTILSVLIDEMIKAEPYMLPAVEITNGVNRISREAMQGLIARISLSRGGYSLRPDYTNPRAIGTMVRPTDYLKYYEYANKYSKLCIDGGTNKLGLSYRDVFFKSCQEETPIGDDAIWEIAFPTGKYSTGFGTWTGVKVENNANIQWGYNGINVKSTVPYFCSFDTFDIRRSVTLTFIGYYWNPDTKRVEQRINTTGDGFYRDITFAKWNLMWKKNPLGAGVSNNSGINFIALRYADVLLMYAETENEIHNGPTAGARTALGQVRKRAFPESKHAKKIDQYLSSLASKEDFFEAIVNERSWELGGENSRKRDLIRWNLLTKKLREVLDAHIEICITSRGLPTSPGSTTYTSYAPAPIGTTVTTSYSGGTGATTVSVTGKYRHIPPYFWWKKNTLNGNIEFKGIDTIYYENNTAAIAGYTKQSLGHNGRFTSNSTSPSTMEQYVWPTWRRACKGGEYEQDPIVYVIPIHTTQIQGSNGNLINYYGKY